MKKKPEPLHEEEEEEKDDGASRFVQMNSKVEAKKRLIWQRK